MKLPDRQENSNKNKPDTVKPVKLLDPDEVYAEAVRCVRERESKRYAAMETGKKASADKQKPEHAGPKKRYSANTEKTVSLTKEDTNDFIQFECAGHIGTREHQQDACKAGTGLGGIVFAVVCDGMGGMEDGGLASREAVELFSRALCEMEPDCDIPAYLTNLAHKANEAVYSLPGKHGERGMSGTTVSAAVINAGSLYWVSVGDSRIYIIRRGEIVAVTRDHSYSLDLSEQVKLGYISQEEAANDPQRNALISYLGMGGELRLIDCNRNPFALEPGDIVLLCSDGLYRSLSEAEILDIVEKHKSSINECAHVLPLYAFDRRRGGGQDNTTVIVIAYQ